MHVTIFSTGGEMDLVHYLLLFWLNPHYTPLVLHTPILSSHLNTQAPHHPTPHHPVTLSSHTSPSHPTSHHPVTLSPHTSSPSHPTPHTPSPSHPITPHPITQSPYHPVTHRVSDEVCYWPKYGWVCIKYTPPLAQWALMAIISTHVRAPHILATATIRWQRLFCSELLIVQLVFEGGI